MRSAIRSSIFTLLFATLASAAPTDYRVLFDVDNNPGTGCTVNGMSGVERVLITHLESSGATATVTSVGMQQCVSGALGPVTPLSTSPTPAVVDLTSGITSLETQIPASSFGPRIPLGMRLGFFATSGDLTAAISMDADGNSLRFPSVVGRRRVIDRGETDRVIVIDGNFSDWAGLPAFAFGGPRDGRPALRIINVFAFADTAGIYFRFDSQSNPNAPTAENDAFTVRPGESLAVVPPGVLANDTDPRGRPLTAAMVTGAVHGAVVLNPDGSLTYASGGGQGHDTFTYQANNGEQPSNVARVDINVSDRPNKAPNAGDDAYQVPGGGTLVISAPGVLTNDNDPDGDTLRALIGTGPQHGTVTLNSDGSFTYTNDGLSNANDSFTYRATDGREQSREATVHLNVQSNVPNIPPVAVDDAYTVNEGGTLTVPAPGLLANDSDPDGLVSRLNITIVTPPARGSLTLGTGGGFTYVHNGSETTSDFFRYQVSDGRANSGIATVTITVIPVNDAPVAIGDAYTTAEDTTLIVGAPGLLSNDSDAEGTVLTSALATAPANGSATVLPNGGFSYTPNPNFNGTDSFTYTATDGTTSSAPATVTITVTAVNDPPSFTSGGNVTVLEDSGAHSAPWATAISAGPANESSQTLSFNVTNSDNSLFSVQPSIAPNGTLTFTPAADKNGSVTVTVTLADNGGGANTSPAQTFTLTITAVNDAPSFAKGADLVVLDTGGAQTVAGWATNRVAGPADESGQAFTFLVSNDNNSLFTVQPSVAPDGTLTFTPAIGATGIAVVTVAIRDNGGTANGGVDTSATQTFTITVDKIPVITSANTTTFIVGAPNSFTVTTLGRPRATIAIGGVALPAGVTFVSNGDGTGTLAGTPGPGTAGTYALTFTASNVHGSSAVQDFTLIVKCPTVTVSNPATSTGTAGTAFTQTFTQSGGAAPAVFTLASGVLPAGLTLATNGTLSGTPTVLGTFPITVKVTDANGCTGTGATYNLVIGCQTITVTNPSNANGTVAVGFSEQFTQSGSIGTPAFSLNSGALPAGITLDSVTGVLSGTPLQSGTFPITIKVTDANGCTGVSPTYTLIIACNVISVTNPTTDTGTAGVAFSQTFTQTGGNGTIVWSTASTLPTGFTLSSGTGVLAGTTTQTGTFPITVTATDGNGCSGTGATYNLVIGCQTINVTNPAVASGTAGSAFNQQFTATGILGTPTWSVASGSLPGGLTLNPANGVVSGTTTQVGSFDITVRVTDSNTCFGTSATYTLVIGCQSITVNSPGVNSGTAGVAFNQSFTASGILGTATWSSSGALPSGVSLNPSTGALSGTPTQTGSFPITVVVTDTNGCTGTAAPYTLTIACPTITVTRSGGGSFPNAPFNTAYIGQSVTATGSNGTPFTFAVTSGALPTGLTLATNGAITGTPSTTGTYTFTVTATDAYSCTGSQSFTIAATPVAGPDSYSNLVNNTQAVVTGGATSSPSTPFIPLTGTLLANDTPGGSVTVTTGTFATTQGGSVTIAVDGTFIYTPPAAPGGARLSSDSFTYTISSNTGGAPTAATATGTATLNLANRVWYVKNNNVVNGNGQSQSPFNNLTSAETASTSGDIIYVYQGDGTTTNQNAGIVLDTNEVLQGQGVALIVNGVTLVSAGGRPVITKSAGGNAIQLAADDQVTGLNVTMSAAGNAIAGSSLTGTVTVSSVDVTASALANGVNLNQTSGSFTFTGNISESGNGIGASAGATGSASVTFNGTISSTGGNGRSVGITGTANTATVTINSTITEQGTGILVNSNTGGTINFTGAITATVNGAANRAIQLLTNTGATINFTSGAVQISSGSARGFDATGGGTVTVTGANNTLSSTTGTALNVSNATIGTNNLVFRSISANGGSNGIFLDTTGTLGGLVVNGDNSSVAVGGNSSGGTIQNMAGADGASSGNGIYLNNTHHVALRRMTISGTNQNHGIRGIGVSDFKLEYSTVTGTNGTSTALDEGSVNFDNLTVTAAITSSVIEGGLEDNLNVVNTSGTLNRLMITGSTFGFNNTVNGNNSILIESQNPGTTLNFTIQGSTIKGARADWINASNNSGSTMDALIGGPNVSDANTFDNLGASAHPGSAAGGNRVVFGAGGLQTVDIRNNTLKGSRGEAIRVRSTVTGATLGNVNARVRDNTVGIPGTPNSGSSEGFGIFGFGDGGASMTIAITNNNIYQYNNHGISLTFGDEINNGSVFNATVTGNTVSNPGNINADFNAIHLNNGTVGATDNFTTCADVGGAGALQNSVAGGGQGTIPPNNNDIRLRQRQSTTVRLPGYGGANNNDAAVVTYLMGRNVLTTAASSNTVPTGGGWIGGAQCTQPSFP